jgi:hypothetical protein
MSSWNDESKKEMGPGKEEYTCYPSTQEAKAGGAMAWWRRMMLENCFPISI